MDRKRFQPKSKKFDEREIYREYSRFSAGVYDDIPATTIPTGGVKYVSNGIVYPNRIEGRKGNRIWSSQLPTVATGITASKSGTTITVTAGYYFTSNDIGKYFVHDDGVHDPILSVTNGFSATTDNSTTHAASTAGKIRGEIYCLGWHSINQKWVLQVESSLYTAPYDMSAWTLLPLHSTITLQRSHSTFREFERIGLLFNSGGWFKIDFDAATPVYYPINTSIPTVRSANSGSGAYKRRILVAFSRLRGTGQLADRTNEGVIVEHESGTNKLDTALKDYSEISSAYAFGSDHPISYTLYPTSADSHFTHYTINATADCGVNGTDALKGEANNPERYWWMADVPIVKAIYGHREGPSGALHDENGAKVFSRYDTNASVRYWTSEGGTGTTETMVTYQSANSFATSAGTALSSGTPATIGGTKALIATQSGYTVTKSGTVGSVFASSDVGKTIYWSDGTVDVITEFTSTSVVTVSKSTTRSALCLAWEPESRLYYDTVSDADLRVRDGWLLKQRFFTSIPHCNIGEIAKGFVFGVQSGDSNLYYCQTGERSLIGYYHPGWHIDRVNDGINVLTAHKTKLVGYCNSSRVEWDLTSAVFMNREDSTESKAVPLGDLPISVITSREEIKGIGCVDRGSVQKTPEGIDIIITQNNELRTYDGFNMSENLIAGRLHKKMAKAQQVSASSYDIYGGYIRWTTEDAGV